MERAGLNVEWNLLPFVRLAPPWMAGLAMGQEGLGTVALTTLCLAAVLAFGWRRSGTLPWARSVACHGLLFLAGFARVGGASPSGNAPFGAAWDWHGPASVCSTPEAKERSIKAVLCLDTYKGPVRVLAYFQKDSAARHLLPGDRIILEAAFRPLDPPALPGAFDYGRFLARQGIPGSGYVRGDRWTRLPGTDNRRRIMRLSADLRGKLSDRIQTQVPDPGAGLARAMLLGDRSAVDPEMRESFQRTGIVHILAVSGLHVGIIYLLAGLVHRPLTSAFPGWKPLGIAWEAVAVWGFAVMTGLGPSVQRAAFMFTLFSAARLTRRDTHALNITVGSAVLLLLLQPGLLHRAGFQLSYAAVAGILIIYPVVYPLWTPKKPWLHKFWQTEVVSLAAVAGTAPISVGLFQQFPLVFPIANLFALPAAFLLVAGTLCLLTTGFLPPLAALTGLGIAGVAATLTQLTDALARLPHSYLDGLHLGTLESVMWYAVIGSAVAAVATRGRHAPSILALLLSLSLMWQVKATDRLLTYRQQDYYLLPDRSGLFAHVGNRNYRFQTDPSGDPLPDMAGHRKFGRINREELLSLPAGKLDSLVAGLMPLSRPTPAE